jgi:hypothetical protein
MRKDEARLPMEIVDYLLRPVKGKVSKRVELALIRAYRWNGALKKPLEEVKDKEFLKVPGIWLLSLSAIRKALEEWE